MTLTYGDTERIVQTPGDLPGPYLEVGPMHDPYLRDREEEDGRRAAVVVYLVAAISALAGFLAPLALVIL